MELQIIKKLFDSWVKCFLKIISFYVIGGFCLSASESLNVPSVVQQLDIFLELASCTYQALYSAFCRKPGSG